MIRKFEQADLNDLLDTWEAASEIAHPFLSPQFMAAERENIPNVYLPHAETWVYEDGERVVGFVALIGNEVGAIFVRPSHQRQGVGKALMDKARELRGKLDVEVFAANQIGRAFYERYGFVHVQDKVHEPTGLDLLRLQLAGS